MKIRNGFVSNSSSSSFIIATRRHLKNVYSKDTIEELFRHKPVITMMDHFISASVAIEYLQAKNVFDNTLSAEEVKKVIVENDCLNFDKNDIRFEKFEGGSIEGDPKYSDYRYEKKGKTEKDCEKVYKEAFKKFRTDLAEIYLKENMDNNSFYYLFTISDNDGILDAILEHGDAFVGSHCIKFSNH